MEYCLESIWCVFYESSYGRYPVLYGAFSSKEKAEEFKKTQSFTNYIWIVETDIQ